MDMVGWSLLGPRAVGLANWFYILGVGNSCAPVARIGAVLEEVLGGISAQDLILGSQWFPVCLIGSMASRAAEICHSSWKLPSLMEKAKMQAPSQTPLRGSSNKKIHVF